MNKLHFLYIISIIILFASCRPEVINGPLAKTERQIIAYPYMAEDVPVKLDNGFLFIREDFSLVNITDQGEDIVLTNLAGYFPVLSDEFDVYDYFHLKKGNRLNEILVYSVIENPVIDDYTNLVFLKTDESGNVHADLNIEIQSVDSIIGEDSLYTREFVDLNTINTSVWFAFYLSKQGPQSRNVLEFIKYSYADSLEIDTSFNISSRIPPLCVIQSNNRINVFMQDFSPQAMTIQVKSFTENFDLVDSFRVAIPATQIYYSKILTNGNYLIAGLEMTSSESDLQNNFLAEIAPNGIIVWHKNSFSDDYLFYYDIIEAENGFIACGLFSLNQDYPNWADIRDKTSSAFFVGFVSSTADSLSFANTSNYGASVGVGIKKTDYGYALLNYMSFVDGQIEEDYMWLYKLNDKLKLQ